MCSDGLCGGCTRCLPGSYEPEVDDAAEIEAEFQADQKEEEG